MVKQDKQDNVNLKLLSCELLRKHLGCIDFDNTHGSGLILDWMKDVFKS